jgi:hypothetical protein
LRLFQKQLSSHLLFFLVLFSIEFIVLVRNASSFSGRKRNWRSITGGAQPGPAKGKAIYKVLSIRRYLVTTTKSATL